MKRLSFGLFLAALVAFAGAACTGVNNTRGGEVTRAYDANFDAVIEAAGNAARELRLNIESAEKEDAITYVISCAEQTSSAEYGSDSGPITTSRVSITIRRKSLQSQKPVDVRIRSTRTSQGGSGLGGTTSTSSTRTNYGRRILRKLDNQFPVYTESSDSESSDSESSDSESSSDSEAS